MDGIRFLALNQEPDNCLHGDLRAKGAGGIQDADERKTQKPERGHKILSLTSDQVLPLEKT